MSPTTYYFLSVRILAACLVAGIARHIVEAVPVLRNVVYNSNNEPVGLAVLGFLIGWNPTLWINELIIWASDFVKRRIPAQRWPAAENLPQNMTLSMLQGMVEEKIERLVELDIDNCQKLARENAILIWLRTAYSLEVVMDWIAQAQLCVLFEDEKMEKLRQVGIRDIFGYVGSISEDASRTAIESVLRDIPLAIIANHASSIAADPAYQRLVQLRQALQPG